MSSRAQQASMTRICKQGRRLSDEGCAVASNKLARRPQPAATTSGGALAGTKAETLHPRPPISLSFKVAQLRSGLPPPAHQHVGIKSPALLARVGCALEVPLPPPCQQRAQQADASQ